MKSIEDRVAAAIAEALVVERSRVVAAASLRGDLNGDSLNQAINLIPVVLAALRNRSKD